jgi:hypothetical protein
MDMVHRFHPQVRQHEFFAAGQLAKDARVEMACRV